LPARSSPSTTATELDALLIGAGPLPGADRRLLASIRLIAVILDDVPDDAYQLQRFVEAQDAGATYESAVAQLRRGYKTSHWMWFVFPQLSGLGRSVTAQTYAISSLDEARAYLAHPVLGPRLIECASIVAVTEGRSAVAIFGATDAMKLHSSMTLFLRAEPDQSVFAHVLDRFFDGVADTETDRLL
jgi:uncharacterized protein (DUF1810 family)